MLEAATVSWRHSRATSQANSLERTSHKPSLASIKHSSSGSLLVKVISGSDITTDLRYLSPVQSIIQVEKSTEINLQKKKEKHRQMEFRKNLFYYNRKIIHKVRCLPDSITLGANVEVKLNLSD